MLPGFWRLCRKTWTVLSTPLRAGTLGNDGSAARSAASIRANSPLIVPALVSVSRNSQIVRAYGTRSDSPKPKKRMNESRSLMRISERSSERVLAAWMTRTLKIMTGSNGADHPVGPSGSRALPPGLPGRSQIHGAAKGHRADRASRPADEGDYPHRRCPVRCPSPPLPRVMQSESRTRSTGEVFWNRPGFVGARPFPCDPMTLILLA